MNLDDTFATTARRQASHCALVCDQSGRAMTYQQLDDAIQDASETLRAAGVGAGDCVGLHYRSGVEYIVYNYAIWRCGGCVVPIPVELAEDEKRDVVKQIAMSFVIAPRRAARFAEPFLRAEARALSADAVVLPVRSPREHPDGFRRLNSAFVRFTSGTTGASKGVVLSHESIRERIAAANEVLCVGPDDRVLWVLSMSYHFTVSIVGYLSLGATIVLPANGFAPAMIEAIQRHRATFLYASPMHFALLADSAQAAVTTSLRMAISTTASLERHVAAKFHRTFGLPVAQALGIIEVGLPCINLEGAGEDPDAVGRVLPAYRVRMEDAGLGPDLQQVLFAGPGMLDAYYDPWQTRDQILHDGWFRTGDVGRLNADGRLVLIGRCKDVINVMGMKVFPREIEAVLLSHPQVEAASVQARPDRRLGEAPCALVVRTSDANGDADADGLADELRRLCQARLASYKTPETIQFVTTLPRTPSGKILHRNPS
jgi:long-chain acyl-CoA synthetase